MLVYIVPTYDCNLNCNGCYAQKYKIQFDGYLSWEDFIKIYTKFKNCDKFAFIGGEPAKCKFINEAILYLKNKGKKVIVFTNATMPIHVKPTNIVVNGTNLFNNSIKHQIIERIESYRSQGSKITLRFNIDDQFTEEMTKEAVSISKEQADSVSISILFPAKLSRNLGDSVYFPL